MEALTTRLAGLELDCPFVLASGILGVSASTLGMAASNGAGAVTTKTCGLAPRTGHPGPVILPIPQGMLNAVGLSNPGVDEMVREIGEFKSRFATPLIASIFASTVEEFGEVAAILVGARPDMIEVNVSCPNVASEFGQPFGADFDVTGAVTRTVKAAVGAVPVLIKLTIHCPSIQQMAKVCRDAGADAITAINTVGPGMRIDPFLRRPVLSNLEGGLSGPAILPLAVRAVYRIRQVVDLPIIGTGGVTSVDDAIQMLAAGATAVGVGTAIAAHGPRVFAMLRNGLTDYLDQQKLRLDDLRGAAHER